MSVALPSEGQIVRIRTRTWLVEQVDADSGYGSTVALACLDDDAQGEQLSVNWDLELDRTILSEEGWKDIGKRGFDPPRQLPHSSIPSAGTVSLPPILDCSSLHSAPGSESSLTSSKP